MLGPDETTDLVYRLRADQRRRWLSGQRVELDWYLSRYPELTTHVEALLDLVYSEFCLREEFDGVVDTERYLARFPKLAPQLMALFEVHAALAGAETTGFGRSPDGRRTGFPRRLNWPGSQEPLSILDDRLAALVVGSEQDQNAGPPVGLIFYAPCELRPGDGTAPDFPGGYKLQSEVGRGATGVVYRAAHARTGETKALKAILLGPFALGDELAAFCDRARRVAALRHSNIATLDDVGVRRGVPYLIGELLEGGNLDDRLKHAPLDERQAVGWFEQLARALAYAHQLGVTHGNVKPTNVVFTPNNTPKLCDFTLAGSLPRVVNLGCLVAEEPKGKNVVERLRQLGAMCSLPANVVVVQTSRGALAGHPAYLAPEQRQGRLAEVGPAADVYALGVTLNEAVFGRRPKSGPSAASAGAGLEAGDQSTIAPRGGDRAMNAEIEAAVRRCLRPDPAERCSAAELAAELARYLSRVGAGS